MIFISFAKRKDKKFIIQKNKKHEIKSYMKKLHAVTKEILACNLYPHTPQLLRDGGSNYELEPRISQNIFALSKLVVCTYLANFISDSI